MSMFPSGRGFTDDDSPATGREGWWDSPAKIIGLGILLPLGLILWAAIDLWRGRVWLPGGRFSSGETFTFEHHMLVVVGVVLVKLAAAVVAVAEWGLGNHPRLGWHSHAVAIVAMVVAGLAVVLTFAGVLT